MNPDLKHQVLDALKRDYQLKERDGVEWLRQGVCPVCQKKELYINGEHPWVLRCGRLNKCGGEWHVKDLYPDFFDDWSKRYKPTKEDPLASAKAYLQYSRGFDLERVKGGFSQEYYFDVDLQIGSATVRFPLDHGGYWERLIDKPHRFGKKKARFAPGKSYRGHWWQPATVNLDTVQELWIVEGIFDAIALLHHDIDAVAALSSNAWPEESLTALAKRRGGRLPTLVWALDGDQSGRHYTRKWVRKARDLGFVCKAAQIPQRGEKIDWNDLHQRGRLNEESLKEYFYHGSLVIAESAVDKALLMYDWRERNEFHFTFENRLYWFKLDLDKYAKARRALDEGDDDRAAGMSESELRKEALASSGCVSEIANCVPEALYFQRNDVTDESWYYFRVDFPHDGPAVKGTFTGGQVSAAAEFKKRLLSLAAGAVFTGSGQQLDRIMKDQLYAIKTVQTIDYIGYSSEYGAYVLGDIAVKDGVTHQVNEEDFFEFGKLRLKTLQKSIKLVLQQDGDKYREDWLDLLWLCFGTKGVTALAFWLGSLFVEQIRERYKSFPFLEATGEAGAGKTTLLTFLWKLFGRDYEGFDPSKSSVAGRSRAMGQVSGMPVVLIEGDRNEPDRAHAKSFDWDELKDFFGGGTLRTRGVKNSGNETYEPPFRGSIVISQNADVSASEAILSRIVKLHFQKPVATDESRAAAANLEQMPVEELSHFLIRAVKNEKAILELFSQRVTVYEQRLRELGEIRMERIIKNHAQMMALIDVLALVAPITKHMRDETLRELADMAVQRQRAISADHPLVAEFWEVFEYLETMAADAVVNHSADPDYIAINLNEMVERASEHRQNLGDLRVLRHLLKDSRSRKFVASNKPTHSAIRAAQDAYGGRSATVKCWIFKK